MPRRGVPCFGLGVALKLPVADGVGSQLHRPDGVASSRLAAAR